jgi:hypothetical protein
VNPDLYSEHEYETHAPDEHLRAKFASHLTGFITAVAAVMLAMGTTLHVLTGNDSAGVLVAVIVAAGISRRQMAKLRKARDDCVAAALSGERKIGFAPRRTDPQWGAEMTRFVVYGILGLVAGLASTSHNGHDVWWNLPLIAASVLIFIFLAARLRARISQPHIPATGLVVADGRSSTPRDISPSHRG